MPKALSRGSITAKSGDNEKLLAINELQKIVGSVVRLGPLVVSTSDAIAHVLWTSEDMPEGALWSFVLTAQAHGGASSAHIIRSALYFRDSGGVTTQFGAGTAISTNRTDANIQIQTATSGNAVLVQVVDAGGRTMDWAVWIEVRVST
jgi:hypothetical protein